jgi:AcrR family transcriptional regulator
VDLDRPDLNLRERKRLATMHRVQTVALDLFDREGFDAVTVERIADDAEVSASSIYRHFGTKEALVIWDEYDPAALVDLQQRLADASPLEALRAVTTVAVQEVFAQDADRVERRLRLAYANPSIEAASALQAYEMAGLIAHVLAGALGRSPGDLDVQVFAHGYVGGLLGALRHWHDGGFTTPLAEVLEGPMSLLERGADLR